MRLGESCPRSLRFKHGIQITASHKGGLVVNVFGTSHYLAYCCSIMSDLLKQVALLDALTDKQSEVLVFVSEGLTSKEIARRLGISESAVNQRIEVIRQRLGGMPRAQIARLYRRQSTLLMTIPTSNSLTGNPIYLQQHSGAAQTEAVEGAANLGGSSAQLGAGVLQPSTNFQARDGSARLWLRLGAIVAIAFGIAATALVVFSIAMALERLLTR